MTELTLRHCGLHFLPLRKPKYASGAALSTPKYGMAVACQGKSPMRQFRWCRSMRRAARKDGLYRDGRSFSSF